MNKLNKKLLKLGISKNKKPSGKIEDEELFYELKIDVDESEKLLIKKIGDITSHNDKIKEITKDANDKDLFNILIDIDDKLGGCCISGKTYNIASKNDTDGTNLIDMSSGQLAHQIKKTFCEDVGTKKLK